jgi:ABC-type Fe3+/spermidine/putrescine transport system ATPase subunit
MGALTLANLTVGYARQMVVENFDLRVDDGELVALLGPSGAGKTTILKVAAGLLTPQAGDVRIDGLSVLGRPPERRDAVMVFQKPLLFPFMDVSQNVSFGLRMRGQRGADVTRRVARIMALTQLQGLGRRKVHALSGGQQQRVALARALVLEPAVLLLDEPLSNLDANLRQQMRELILSIQAELRITTLFVTHDQAEALMMAHRVGLLLDGRLRQMGPPRELFYHPSDPDVARFFGGLNFFEGRVHNRVLHTALGPLAVGPFDGNGHVHTATIRPEDIQLDLDEHGGANALTGTVRRTSFEGMTTRIWVRCRGGDLVVLTPVAALAPGQSVRLHLPPDKIHIFPSPAS